MSTVRTLALGALMLVGVAGVSAAQSTATPRRPEAGSYRRGPGGRDGFGRDLNLTDAQKAQIKTIRAKYQPQSAAVRAQAKPLIEAANAARQKGDTAAFRSNMAQAHQVMQNATYRTQQQAEIRAILTPEQQVKFDARAKERAQGGHKGWGHKGKGEKPATK
jgi:Spy/CpxP family protein refolding chaperone